MHHGDHLAINSALQRDREPNLAIEGIVVTGSYDPVNGTVQVQIGDTVAVFQDSGDQPLSVQAVLETTGLGDQYGPVGGERALLTRTQSGWSVRFEHGYDDSPQAPAGERWICHRDKNGNVNAAIKLTNDGATPGDGKGGIEFLFGELAEIITHAGFKILCDDIANRITIQTPGGLVVVLDDNAHTVSLGTTGLSTSDGVVRKSDLQTAVNAVIANTNTAISQLAARVQGGTGVGPSTVSGVSATGSTHVLSQS